MYASDKLLIDQPDFFVHFRVGQRSLVQVLPERRSQEISAWVIYPVSRHKNPRIKLIVETQCSKFNEFITYPGYSFVPQVSLDGAQSGEVKISSM